MSSYNDYQNILWDVNWDDAAGQLLLNRDESDSRTYVEQQDGKTQFYYAMLSGISDYNALGYYGTGDINLPAGGLGLNTVQTQIIQSILGPASDPYRVSFEDVANIEFNAGTTANAQITFGQYTNSDEGTFGFTVLESTVPVSTVKALQHGDVWLNANFSGWDQTAKGTDQYIGIMHEIAHALGLDHTDGTSIDSQQYSIMSYVSLDGMDAGVGNVTDDVNPFGLQLYDIVAMQEIYGRNYETRNTDTVYDKNGAFASDRLNDAFVYTIWDGGGNDTIDASDYTDHVTIDLRQGEFSSIGYNVSGGLAANNLAIAYHAVIENAVGTNDTSEGDILIGNAWSNVLEGLAGDDFLYGDGVVYDGDEGFSDVEEENPDGYAPESDDDILDPGVGADEAYGGAGNDLFLAAGLSNLLEGDLYHGGSGSDTVDYSAIGYGLKINLNDSFGSAQRWDSATDTVSGTADDLISIENVIGTSYDDYIKGYYTSNVIHGGEGADIIEIQDYTANTIAGYRYDIVYGDAGNDTFILEPFSSYMLEAYGGSGIDTLNMGAADAILGAGTVTAVSGFAQEMEIITLGNDYGANWWNTKILYVEDLGWTYEAGSSSSYSGQFVDYSALTPALTFNLSGTSWTVTDGVNSDTYVSAADAMRSLSTSELHLMGSNNGDTYAIGGGNEVIFSGTGDDTVNAENGGFEYIYTGGADVFSFAVGDTAYEDITITLGNGIQAGDVSFSVANPSGINGELSQITDLTITISGYGSIVVENIEITRYYGADNVYFTNDDVLTYHMPDVVIEGIETLSKTGPLAFTSTDTYTQSEGTQGSDTLTGDASGGSLRGYAGDDTLNGGSGSDSLIGDAGDDSLYGNGGGDYLSGGLGADHLYGGADGDTLYGSQGMDMLDGGAGVDTLDGGADDDTLLGGSGDDTLLGGYGNDTLTGGTGADTLEGGAGTDTYIWSVGDGNDTITEIDSANELVLHGVVAQDLVFTLASNGDLTITIGSEQISIPDFAEDPTDLSTAVISKITLDDTTEIDLTEAIPLYGTSGDETLTASDYVDAIYGGDGIDTIYAGEGNDYLYGGADADFLRGEEGDDTYIWSVGDGNDIIYDSLGIDTLYLKGVTPADVTFNSDGYSLYVQIGSETIELRRHLDSSSYAIEMLRFDDETEIDLTSGLSFTGSNGDDSITGYSDVSNVIDGGSGDDIIWGGSEGDALSGGADNDNLYGQAGNDTLNGGTGSDYLSGGAGDDTYVWSVGDGDDSIYETSGADTLTLQGVDANDITYQVSGSDILVHVGSETITLQNQAYSSNSQIETLILDDATQVSLTSGLTFSGTSGDDYLQGLTGQPNHLQGLAGNDTLIGSSESDILVGGTGNDYLFGYDGDDTFEWSIGDGNDSVYAGSGADQLVLHGVSLSEISFGNDDYGESIRVNIGSEYINIAGLIYGYSTDVMETLVLDDGTVDLTAGLTFEGTSLDDAFSGTVAGDTLYGYAGNDTLHGGGGDDTLYGGTGADRFVFRNLYDTPLGNDVIADLDAMAGDVIDITDMFSWDYDPNIAVITDYVRIVENGADSLLQLDVDGGADAFVTIATISNVTGITDVQNLIDAGTLIVPRLDINFNDVYFDSYGGSQDAGGTVAVTVDGYGVEIAGNAWKQAGIYYSITENTILEFDYKSTIEGELQGVVLETDDDYTTGAKVIQLYGTDNNARFDRSYDYSGSGDWEHFGINASEYASGSIFSIGFVNDHDNGAQNANSLYQNFKLYEANAVEGTTSGDDLTGTANTDILRGFEGDDTLAGGEGMDLLYGGAGADIFMLEAASAFNNVDVIKDFSLSDADKIDVSDILAGYYDAVTDTLSEFVQIVENGDDTLIQIDQDGGGDHFVTVASLFGVTGLSDADSMVLSGNLIVSDAQIIGTASVEILTGTSSDDLIYGLEGNDQLKGNSGADYLYGGAGDDQLYGYYWGSNGSASDIDTAIYQGNFSDYTLSWSILSSETRANGDVLRVYIEDSADGGSDGLDEGRDFLQGVNVVQFADRSFTIYEGTAESETIVGSNSDDLIYALDGGGEIKGVNGSDYLYGGSGDDRIYGHSWGSNGNASDIDTAVYQGNFSDYTLDWGIYSSSSRINGDVLRVYIEDSANGGSDGVDEGSDYLQGINVVQFADRSFTIHEGSASSETLNGTSGDDLLYGQDGLDLLYGQSGADTFVFEADSAFNDVDEIKDFSESEGDVIDIADLLTAYDPLNDAIADFVSFTESSGDTIISVDQDGTGTSYSAQNVVTIDNVTGLDISDLISNNQLIVV